MLINFLLRTLQCTKYSINVCIRMIFFSILQVRTRFIAKLHKGLARGIPFKCLPLDFLGFYAIVGMDPDKTVREGTKRYMIGDINSRKDCIKTMTYSSCKFLTSVTEVLQVNLCQKLFFLQFMERTCCV